MRKMVLALWLLTACVVPNRQLGRGTRLTPHGRATAPVKPGAEPSDEATDLQLQLARDQGSAAGRALGAHLARPHRSSGRSFAGEYEVAWFVDAPHGSWERVEGGALQWRAGKGGFYLGVAVLDGADGRTVPGLTVRASFDGAEPRELPFRWHPSLDHYGANFPPASVHQLRVEIAPPAYQRHDPLNGDRFAEETFAEFDAVTTEGDGSAPDDDAQDVALGRAQGDQLLRAFAEMAHATANDGEMLTVGDVRVACAVEFAETYWQMDHGELTYDSRPEQSAETNAHLEVTVLDGLSGRFLPGLAVHAAIENAGEADVPFMWHPWLYHYGRNWRVPGAGRYRVRVHVDPPAWARESEALGKRFERPIDFECPELKVEVGQK